MKKLGLVIALSGVFSLVAVGSVVAAPNQDKKTEIKKTTNKTPLGYKRILKKERKNLPEWGTGNGRMWGRG